MDHHHEKGKKIIMDQNNNTNQKCPSCLSRQVSPFCFLLLGKGVRNRHICFSFFIHSFLTTRLYSAESLSTI